MGRSTGPPNQNWRNCAFDIEIAQQTKLKPIGISSGRSASTTWTWSCRTATSRPSSRCGCSTSSRTTAGQAGAGHRGHADQVRRGQDDGVGRPVDGVQPAGQEVDRGAAPAVARAGVRHQGRRGRRRVFAGPADGGHQPPLHRRLPRRHLGAQPAVGDARQLDPLRQPAPHRRPRDSVPAHHRHERPRAADDGRRASAAGRTGRRARTAASSPRRRR